MSCRRVCSRGASLLLLMTLFFIRSATTSAQGGMLCGWIESTPKPTLFVEITEPLVRAYGLTEDNFGEVGLGEIQGRYWIIDLDNLAGEDIAHYGEVAELDPGYFRVFDPDFISTSGWSSLRSYSWLEPVSTCDSMGPAITPLPVSAATGGGYICGQMIAIDMPFKYVFTYEPSDGMSASPILWEVDLDFWSVAQGIAIDMYTLEDKYLRIWMPDVDPNGGDIYGEPVPLLKSVADYEIIPRCDETSAVTPTRPAPTATPTRPAPTATPTRRPPTATPTRRPPTATPTPTSNPENDTVHVTIKVRGGFYPDDGNTYKCQSAVLSVVRGDDQNTLTRHQLDLRSDPALPTNFGSLWQHIPMTPPNECLAVFEDVELTRSTYNNLTVAISAEQKQGEYDEWKLIVGSQTTILRVNDIVIPWPWLGTVIQLEDISLWPSDGRKAVVLAPQVEVHTAPGAQFPRIATVFKGAELAVVGSSSGWWEVCCFLEDRHGWVSGAWQPVRFINVDNAYAPDLPTSPTRN